MMRKWMILTTAIFGFQTASAQYFDLVWFILDAAYNWDRGEVEVRATEFAGQPAVMYGLRGSWDTGDRYSAGIGAYYSRHTFDLPRSLDYRSMDYFYTTFFMSYHINVFRDLEVSIPFQIGYGGLHLEGNAFNYVPDDHENMFIVEPGVMMNWYPFSWMRVYGGGAFRINAGTYAPGIRNHELSAPSAVFGVGFGKYY